MDELIKSSRNQGNKSRYLIELRKHQSGKHYIKIDHFLNCTNKKTTLHINPEHLPFIIETLFTFSKEIDFQEKTSWKTIDDIENEKLIVSFFLKGVTIKDLSLVYRYPEQKIVDILIKNEIVIIDGIDLPKPRYFRKKKR